MQRITSLWFRLTATYWFVPALMMLGAVLLYLIATALDDRVDTNAYGALYSGSPDGARSLLSTIAASMITVAGVVFSMTLVALTVAASQFGPNLLKNFMRDTGNQVVLGTFLASFLFSILVLRRIRTVEDGGDIVPRISVTLAILLAIAGLAVVVFFIHHVSTSLQSQNVVARAGHNLASAVRRYYAAPGEERRTVDESRLSPTLKERLQEASAPVRSLHTGYLQSIDNEALMDRLRAEDAVLELHIRQGDFVVEGQIIGHLWPAATIQELRGALQRLIAIGTERTLYQDPMFGIQQIVEVALRALSPGVNLPFLAVQAVDQLTASLVLLAGRDLRLPLHLDDDGEVRMIAPVFRFADFVDASFGEIRRNSAGSLIVKRRLLTAIQAVSEEVRTEEQRQALAREAQLVEEQTGLSEAERAELHETSLGVLHRLRRDGEASRRR